MQSTGTDGFKRNLCDHMMFVFSSACIYGLYFLELSMFVFVWSFGGKSYEKKTHGCHISFNAVITDLKLDTYIYAFKINVFINQLCIYMN